LVGDSTASRKRHQHILQVSSTVRTCGSWKLSISLMLFCFFPRLFMSFLYCLTLPCTSTAALCRSWLMRSIRFFSEGCGSSSARHPSHKFSQRQDEDNSDIPRTLTSALVIEFPFLSSHETWLSLQEPTEICGMFVSIRQFTGTHACTYNLRCLLLVPGTRLTPPIACP
jgi:hypothetical protein